MGFDRRNALLKHSHEGVYPEISADDTITGDWNFSGDVDFTGQLRVYDGGELVSIRDFGVYAAGDVLRIGASDTPHEIRWRVTSGQVRMIPYDGSYQFGKEIYYDTTKSNWAFEGLPYFPSLGNYADDTAAGAAGVPTGCMYRNGSVLMIRVS